METGLSEKEHLKEELKERTPEEVLPEIKERPETKTGKMTS